MFVGAGYRVTLLADDNLFIRVARGLMLACVLPAGSRAVDVLAKRDAEALPGAVVGKAMILAKPCCRRYPITTIGQVASARFLAGLPRRHQSSPIRASRTRFAIRLASVSREVV